MDTQDRQPLMVWEPGREGSHIPDRIKRIVRHRDNNTCQLRYPGICTGKADQFDHIDGITDLGISRNSKQANNPNALRCVCEPCHKKRTQEQATAGKRRWKRPPEKHPGLI